MEAFSLVYLNCQIMNPKDFKVLVYKNKPYKRSLIRILLIDNYVFQSI